VIRYRPGRATPSGLFRRPDISSYARFSAACRKAGERNLIGEIIDAVNLKATMAPNSPIASGAGLLERRPFYTPAELSYLWPLICVGLAGKENGVRPPSPEHLRKRLLECKLPLLRQANGGTWFEWRGQKREFFVVQNIGSWGVRAWTQLEFDAAMQPPG